MKREIYKISYSVKDVPNQIFNGILIILGGVETIYNVYKDIPKIEKRKVLRNNLDFRINEKINFLINSDYLPL